VCAWLVESFPASMRLTSVAFGYNVAHAIVGGSAPVLATYLVDKYGPHAPGYMVTVIASFSVIGLYIAPEKENEENEESPDPNTGGQFATDSTYGDLELAATAFPSSRQRSVSFPALAGGASPATPPPQTFGMASHQMRPESRGGETHISYDDDDHDDDDDDDMSFGHVHETELI